MGLDMYLYRNRDQNEEVGYWRKANAIHGWIVENVQNGQDDCEIYEFPLEKMLELYFLCKKVIKNPLKYQVNLKPMSGCFFGSYNYDVYYIEYLKNTVKILEKALKQPQDTYQYQSSW